MSHHSVTVAIVAAILAAPTVSIASVLPPPVAWATSTIRIDYRFQCAQPKDPDLAIDGCRALIAANPEDGLAHLSLGLAYERIGDTGEALNAFIGATSVGYRRTEANAQDGDAWLLIVLASRGAARVAKDEPDMRNDFASSARDAAQRATALGVPVPQVD